MSQVGRYVYGAEGEDRHTAAANFLFPFHQKSQQFLTASSSATMPAGATDAVSGRAGRGAVVTTARGLV